MDLPPCDQVLEDLMLWNEYDGLAACYDRPFHLIICLAGRLFRDCQCQGQQVNTVDAYSVSMDSDMKKERDNIMSLRDKIAILEVIAQYSYTYDGRDADGFAHLFTEDGIFEVIYAGGHEPELRLKSRDAIYAWAAQRHQEVVKDVQDRHFQSGTLFDVLSWEYAQTRTMVLITHQRADDPAPRPVLSGVYHDRWQRTRLGWQIAQRTLHHDHRRPYLSR